MYAKCDHLLDFDDTLRVISLLLEIFRRLKSISIASYTPKTVHASFIVDKCRTSEKCDNFLDFEESWALFRFVGDISTCIRYFHFISHAECDVRQFQRRKTQTCAKNATICSILKKTVRYIAPVGDISTFILYFQCIFHADCYACRF